jgi:hypothetical protein
VGFDPHEPRQRRMLAAAMTSAGIEVGELWLKYFSLGGDAGEYEVEAYVRGLLSLPVLERDLLAMAANELHTQTPHGNAPYFGELSPDNGSPSREPETRQQRRAGPDPETS